MVKPIGQAHKIDINFYIIYMDMFKFFLRYYFFSSMALQKYKKYLLYYGFFFLNNGIFKNIFKNSY